MLKHVVLFAGIAAVFAFLARGTADYGPYIYDEADYMYAVGSGLAANWIDSPSTPLAELVKLGLDRPGERGRKLELSEIIRGSNDILFYRHWHGPVYVAWLDFAQRLFSGEREIRALNRVFALLTAAVMYWGAVSLLPGAAGTIAAVLAAVLYLWSFAVVRSTELAPHQLFALVVAAALVCLAKMFQTTGPARMYWYAAVAFGAVALCVLEVAFALIFTLLICGYLARERLKFDFSLAVRSAGVFLATVLVIWPAAVFKLSVVKSYLFMAYLALFRRGAWGSDIGVGGTWRLRLIDSPVPWLLFAIAAVYFWKRRSKAPMLIPFALFTLMMFLTIVRVNTETPRYTLPILPGVVMLGALACGMMLEGGSAARRITSTVVICAAMLFTSWPAIRAKMPGPNERADAELALVSRLAPESPVLLVPHDDVPMLHYYFPKLRFKTYYDPADIPSEFLRAPVDGVILGDPPRFSPAPKPQ